MTEVPLRRLALISYGLGQPPPEAESGVAIIRATNIERGRIVSEGMMFSALEDLPLDRAPLLAAGEVLVVRSGAYTGDSAMVTTQWVGSAPGYDLRVSPGAELEPRFLAYSLLGSRALDAMHLSSTRAAQPHLNAEELGDVPITRFSRSSQHAIANFLDTETARIGAVIERRQRLIALAEERFRNLREQRLYGGTIDRWISIGRLIDVLPGVAFPSDDFVLPDEAGAVRLLRGANVTPGRVRWNDTVALPAELATAFSAWQLKVGDLVLGMDRPMISSGMRVAAVTSEDVPCLLVQRVARIRAKVDGNQDYIQHLLTSDAFVGYFEPIVTGVSVPHISDSQIRAFRVPLRSADAQSAIADELSDARRDLDALRSSAARQIALLQEHRQALITAAVTGQIDVTRAVA